ncbi:hypothetical protein Glove_79g34 [Diversispora epigaea]|uniref:Uncharacterized protein n=1 Tax=Diversispora epigaea TaxID=1348612 RepID=A0A397JAR7_9GLOM|nr:hypothetical protein Glove_79g34 [Diversispora epigaea]
MYSNRDYDPDINEKYTSEFNVLYERLSEIDYEIVKNKMTVPSEIKNSMRNVKCWKITQKLKQKTSTERITLYHGKNIIFFSISNPPMWKKNEKVEDNEKSLIDRFYDVGDDNDENNGIHCDTEQNGDQLGIININNIVEQDGHTRKTPQLQY